ncbi:MAG TPA: ribosome maturation factor RimM [Terriglobales bacterium]|nr:ribosome maturation factor RimM [Terriglobales bacterium]
MATADEFISIARVLGTQGRRGEVAAELHTGLAERFKAGFKLLALGENDSRRELQIQETWSHKDHLILKFVGVDSISEAESLVGCELQVRRAERAQLKPGWAYISDLVGCTVFNQGQEIGKIVEVKFGAGEAPLLIVRGADKEHEVPYAEAYLQKQDLDRREIRMLLPEGMLELDAPLTAEEKQQQRKK